MRTCWLPGFANVLFNAKSKKLQYGYLLTWQTSFAGDSDREDVNIGAFQPFLFYQLGHGTYLRSAPIWAYNFENDAYSIPIGLGIGKVIPKGKTVFNLFIEPQYSVAWRGVAWRGGDRGSPTGRSSPDSICSSPINGSDSRRDRFDLPQPIFGR